MPRKIKVSAIPDVAFLEKMRAAHRRRNFAMDTTLRQHLSLLAYLRMHLGYVNDRGKSGDDDKIKLSAEQKARNKDILDEIKTLVDVAEKRVAESAKPEGKRVEIPAGNVDPKLLMDVVASFMAMLPIEQIKGECEKSMVDLVQSLTIWDGFGKPICGFGPMSCAVIIAELGNPSDYTNPGKVWRRFGVAPTKANDGKDHLPSSLRAADLTKAEWSELGYSPRRRSKLYSIGDSLLRQQSAYRDVYMKRKAQEHHKAEANLLIPATEVRKTMEDWAAIGLPPLTLVKKINPDLHMSASHMDKRARVYATKRLLRDFWRAWVNEYGVTDREGYEEYRQRAEAFAPTQEAA